MTDPSPAHKKCKVLLTVQTSLQMLEEMADAQQHVPIAVPSDQSAAHQADNSYAIDQVLSNEDLLKEIFSCLPVLDICRLSCVCPLWLAVTNCDDFWQDVDFASHTVTRAQVLGVCRRHPHIRNLSLEGRAVVDFGTDGFIQELAPFVSQVLTFKLSGGLVPERVLTSLLTLFQSMTCLTLSRVCLQRNTADMVGAPVHGDITLSHAGLTEVLIQDCLLYSMLRINCPEMRHLSLRQTMVPRISLHTTTLTSLDLFGCKIVDADLRHLLVLQSRLVELDIGNSTELSNTTVRDVAVSCPLLVSLNLSGCLSVTLSNVRDFKALRFLNLSASGVLGEALTSALESCLTLEEVVLDNCQALDTLCLRMGALKVISVLGCHHLSKMELHCRRLETLSLTPPPGEVGCCALKQISLFSDSMLALELRQCSVLDSLELECHALQDLLLQDCDCLGDQVFEMLSDTPFHYQKDSHLPSHPSQPRAKHASLPYPSSSVAALDTSKPRLTHTLLSKGPFKMPDSPVILALPPPPIAVPQHQALPQHGFYNGGLGVPHGPPWGAPGPWPAGLGGSAPQAHQRLILRRGVQFNVPSNAAHEIPQRLAHRHAMDTNERWAGHFRSPTEMLGESDDDLDEDLQEHIMSAIPPRIHLSRALHAAPPVAFGTVPVVSATAVIPSAGTIAPTALATGPTSSHVSTRRKGILRSHSLLPYSEPAQGLSTYTWDTFDAGAGAREPAELDTWDTYLESLSVKGNRRFADEPLAEGDLQDYEDFDPDLSGLYMHPAQTDAMQDPTSFTAAQAAPTATDLYTLSEGEAYRQAAARWAQRDEHQPVQQQPPPLHTFAPRWFKQPQLQPQPQPQLKPSALTRRYARPSLTPSTLFQGGVSLGQVRPASSRGRAIQSSVAIPEDVQSTAVTPAAPEAVPAAAAAASATGAASANVLSSSTRLVSCNVPELMNPTANESPAASIISGSSITGSATAATDAASSLTAAAVLRSSVAMRQSQPTLWKSDSDEEAVQVEDHTGSPGPTSEQKQGRSGGFFGRIRQLIPNPLSFAAAPPTQPAQLSPYATLPSYHLHAHAASLVEPPLQGPMPLEYPFQNLNPSHNTSQQLHAHQFLQGSQLQVQQQTQVADDSLSLAAQQEEQQQQQLQRQRQQQRHLLRMQQQQQLQQIQQLEDDNDEGDEWMAAVGAANDGQNAEAPERFLRHQAKHDAQTQQRHSTTVLGPGTHSRVAFRSPSDVGVVPPADSQQQPQQPPESAALSNTLPAGSSRHYVQHAHYAAKARAGTALRGAMATAAFVPFVPVLPVPWQAAAPEAGPPVGAAHTNSHFVPIAQTQPIPESPLVTGSFYAQMRIPLLGSLASVPSIRHPTPAASSRACGGVPGLRVLMVVGCDAIGRVGLRHRQLQSFTVSGCKSLNGVRLEARQLGHLTMERCDELGCVELKGVGVKALSLGTCSSLSTFILDSPVLEKLELKGCGILSSFTLATPRLNTLDATFCGALTDASLVQGLAHTPLLHTLLLSVCTRLESGSIQSLGGCSDSLRILDLSYTGVTDLTPLFAYAPNLTSLNLASCRMLPASALQQMLPSEVISTSAATAAAAASGPASPPAEMLNPEVAVTSPLDDQTAAALSQMDTSSDTNSTDGNTSSGSSMDQQSPCSAGVSPSPVVDCSSALLAAAAAWSGSTHPISGPVLPNLQILDLSYCLLPEEAVARLLRDRPALHTLTLSGCEGVTAAMWPSLHRSRVAHLTDLIASGQAASGSGGGAGSSSSQGTSSTFHESPIHPDDGGSNLTSLTLVKCSKLSSLCLGLVPAPGCVLLNKPPRRYSDPLLDMCQVEAEVRQYQWVPTGCLLSNLTTLRLGLSGVQVLALRLPKLAHLCANGAGSLRVLELRCPLLLTLNLQACNSLARSILPFIPYSAFALQTLDLQFVLLTPAERDNLRRAVSPVAVTKLLGCE